MRILFGLLAAILLQGSAGADEILSLETRDGTRQAVVVPAGPSGTPKPTIIVLHAARFSVERTMRTSGFVEAAAAHGFTAVFPEGVGRRWNDARNDGKSSADDVGFLTALIQQLVRAKAADPSRIYIAGISNGGMMALTMICEAGGGFAGLGTVIANLPASLAAACPLPKPIPVVMVNGTADPIVPFDGGGVGFHGRNGKVLGSLATAALFAKSDRCGGPSETALPDRDPSDSTQVRMVTFQDCAPGTVVKLYEIQGGGHQVPGGAIHAPHHLGKGNDDISAAEEILKAFSF